MTPLALPHGHPPLLLRLEHRLLLLPPLPLPLLLVVFYLLFEIPHVVLDFGLCLFGFDLDLALVLLLGEEGLLVEALSGGCGFEFVALVQGGGGGGGGLGLDYGLGGVGFGGGEAGGLQLSSLEVTLLLEFTTLSLGVIPDLIPERSLVVCELFGALLFPGPLPYPLLLGLAVDPLLLPLELPASPLLLLLDLPLELPFELLPLDPLLFLLLPRLLLLLPLHFSELLALLSFLLSLHLLLPLFLLLRIPQLRDLRLLEVLL